MSQAPAASSSQHPTNKIQVSNSKQPVNFYVNLCKRMLKSGEKEVELSGLGNAIFTVVTVVEILKNQGVVETKSISTSSVAVGNQSVPIGGNGAKKLKPKIQAFVTKSKNFDTIVAQQEKEQEARRQQKQAAVPTQGGSPASPAPAPAPAATTTTKQ